MPSQRQGQRQQRRQRHRQVTTLLVALTRVLERVDEQLLPATYFGVSCSLGASPSQLGAITFARLLVQALASPLGGVLGLRYHRAKVCGGACLAWAVCCALFAGVSSVRGAMAVWALNAVGLAVLVPNAQGLIADLYPPKQRGRAFGMLLGVGHAGAMLATLFATSVGNRRLFVGGGADGRTGGFAGWRLAFLVVGAASAALGVVTAMCAHDPRDEGWGEPADEDDDDDDDGDNDGEERGEDDDERAGLRGADDGGGACGSSSGNPPTAAAAAAGPKPTTTTARRRRPLPPNPQRRPHQSLSSLLADAKRVCAVPSFLVVVAQGVLGSTPWSALAFMTLYLQLRGWPDASAAGVLAAFSAASALGSVLGGFVGDAAARPFPDHGRIAVTQFSVFSGVPLAAALFLAVPTEFSSKAVAATAAVLVAKGVLTQWAATACNNPVFAEVVPPRLRTAVYSLDRMFEGALSALGAPLVGRAAEALFGFGAAADGAADGGAAAAGRCDAVLKGDGGGGGGRGGGAFARHRPDERRADALAKAMLLFTTVPWLLCALVYSALHWTYPRDRRRAQAEAAAEAAGAAGARESGGGRGREDDEEEEELRADRLLDGGGGGAAGGGGGGLPLQVEVELGRLLPPAPLPYGGSSSAATWR